MPTRGLCRPCCEGPAHGGERAGSIGIILGLVITLVPPIAEGETNEQTSKQGHKGAGHGAAGAVRPGAGGEAAGHWLYAADHGERDAADGASEPLAECERAWRSRP